MRRNLVIVLLIAFIGRAVLLASDTVSFHSDEAVVALMARHILQGERPVFFYGQAYMGSLDAWLVAVGFSLFGESVLTIRLVQSALYLLIVASSYWVAWRLSRRVLIATIAALVIALPSVLLAVYTTATLGGYNETLLLGNLLLLLGYDVTHEHRRSWWRWAALGLAAGVGWWSNGLIVAFALPVGLLLLVDLVRQVSYRNPTPNSGRGDSGSSGIPSSPRRGAPVVPLPRIRGRAGRGWGLGIAIALIFFFLGSAPWWAFNIEHDFAPLRFYIVGGERGEFAGTDIPPLPLPERAIGLTFLGVPTLFGLRFPWTPVYFLPLIGVPVLLIYAVALVRLLRARPSPLQPDARWYIAAMIGLFCVLFFVSRFSIDPTGRYFIPLALPLGIVLGTLIASLWESRRWLVRAGAVGIAALVIGYQLTGQISAALTNPPGLTTQFNLDTHIPNTWDADLIAFLDEHGLTHGYTNYWVSFRLAFLSGDRLQYSAAISYKPDLSYTPADDRYRPYREAADAADRIAYITANVPEVKAWLEAEFAERGVTYQSANIGVYHIYYDFAPAAPRPPLD